MHSLPGMILLYLVAFFTPKVFLHEIKHTQNNIEALWTQKFSNVTHEILSKILGFIERLNLQMTNQCKNNVIVPVLNYTEVDETIYIPS